MTLHDTSNGKDVIISGFNPRVFHLHAILSLQILSQNGDLILNVFFFTLFVVYYLYTIFLFTELSSCIQLKWKTMQ